MKHAAIRDRLKLSSLKNKTLLRHPNHHLLQTADSSSKCTPRCCWPLYAERVHCRLLFNFFSHQELQVVFGRAASQLSAPRLYQQMELLLPITGLCTALCWTLWGSCQSFAPNLVTCANTVNAPSDRTKAQHKPTARWIGQISFTRKASAEGQSKRMNSLLATSGKEIPRHSWSNSLRSWN